MEVTRREYMNRNENIAENTLKRLGNYKCEGQMSFEDVDWQSLHAKSANKLQSSRAIMEEESEFTL